MNSTTTAAAAAAEPVFTVSGFTDVTGEKNTDGQWVFDKSAATLIWRIEVNADFATRADAQAYAATLPKALKLKAGGVTNYTVDCTQSFETGRVFASYHLSADKVNGGVNETAIARLRKVLARVPHTFVETYGGNSATVAQLQQFVATGSIATAVEVK